MKIKKILLNKKRCTPLICISILLFLVLVAYMMVLYHRTLFSYIFSIMLLVLGCFSSQFKRMTGNINLGIEFIPFATIMFFSTHGFVFGMLAALLMMVVATLSVGELQLDLFVSLAIFAIIGIIALFLNFGIIINGIILVVIFNILSLIILTFFGFDFVKDLIYFFGSIIFNYILFKYFSEIIYTVISLA
jgi:hypothetical protein